MFMILCWSNSAVTWKKSMAPTSSLNALSPRMKPTPSLMRPSVPCYLSTGISHVKEPTPILLCPACGSLICLTAGAMFGMLPLIRAHRELWLPSPHSSFWLDLYLATRPALFAPNLYKNNLFLTTSLSHSVDISTQISYICLFLQLDLDLLSAVRTPPYHSWKNPVERIMSIINVALQSVGLMRLKSSSST